MYFFIMFLFYLGLNFVFLMKKKIHNSITYNDVTSESFYIK